MEKLRIGIIGFGNRGKVLSKPILENMPDIEVIGICDKYEDRVDFGCKLVEDARGVRPFGTTDYHEILKMDGIDAVICSTDSRSIFSRCIARRRAVRRPMPGSLANSETASCSRRDILYQLYA